MKGYSIHIKEKGKEWKNEEPLRVFKNEAVAKVMAEEYLSFGNIEMVGTGPTHVQFGGVLVIDKGTLSEDRKVEE